MNKVAHEITKNDSLCALCQIGITKINNSSEHIIPNAIGGKQEIRYFICKDCNSTKGKTWEAALAKQLNFFSLGLDIKRTRSRAPAQPVRTTGGGKLFLRQDGTLTWPTPIVEKTKVDGKLKLRVFARTIEEARSILQGIKDKDAPNLDIEKELAGFEAGPFRVDGGIEHRLELGGAEENRSIVKTAFAFAVANGIKAEKCEIAVRTLLSDSDDSGFAPYYINDVVVGRPDDELFHLVSICGCAGRRTLMAYVEYFGFWRVLIKLSDEYDGPDLSYCYSLNPRTGVELKLGVRWDVLGHYTNNTFDGYGSRLMLEMACHHAVAVASHFIKQRERATRFKLELDAVLKEMGLPTGIVPPKSRRDEFNHLMAEKIGDFSTLDSEMKSLTDLGMSWPEQFKS